HLLRSSSLFGNGLSRDLGGRRERQPVRLPQVIGHESVERGIADPDVRVDGQSARPRARRRSPRSAVPAFTDTTMGFVC
ncbi:MAG: hypothetical protein M0C28_23885, partial [Candidatus Moduliflexus flocculans]|nr:hypothetical protein [Candidatus Moduliflexus flocculans]